MNSILFLLKRREDYNIEKHSKNVGLSTGLYNSASFMNDMLVDLDIVSNIEVVIDANDIDREITRYRPTHVILEALWVTPVKLQELISLHRNVVWIIRLHSELPFLAGEGMAMDWIADYANLDNVYIGINAPRMLNDIETFLTSKSKFRLLYMPNFYPLNFKKYQSKEKSEYINIGCFGAIRPLKNHLVQAIAAIKFAESIGKKLKFHVNMGRIEMQGQPVAQNLQDIFVHLWDAGHRLVSHDWTPREEFLDLCSQMDIGMQVSFSETFNIVGADFVSQGVPLVCSREIPWASKYWAAHPASAEEIYKALKRTYRLSRLNVLMHQHKLNNYCINTQETWNNHFGD